MAVVRMLRNKSISVDYNFILDARVDSDLMFSLIISFFNSARVRRSCEMGVNNQTDRMAGLTDDGYGSALRVAIALETLLT